MRLHRPSLWRAPLQAIAAQQQQGKNVLTTDTPNRTIIRTEEGATIECQPEPFSGGGGGATGSPTSFVYRPGGVAGEPGVFVTAPALKAALLTVDLSADKTIVVDDSIAPAHLTAADSPWPLDNVTFEGASGQLNQILIDAGCTFDASTTVIRNRNIQFVVDAAASATPIWTVTGVAVFEFHTALYSNNSPASFIDVRGAGQLEVLAEVASQLQAGGQLATLQNGAIATVQIQDGSSLNDNLFIHGTVAGATLNILLDGASQPNVSTVQDVGNLTVNVTTLDPQPTFVFQPGGVAGGNVFTTGIALATAMAFSAGPKTIVVDSSLAAAHLTAGAYNLDGVTLTAALPFASTLQIDDGATITSGSLRVTGGLIVTSNATHTVWTMASGFPLLVVDYGSTFQSSTATAPLLQTAGNPFIQCNIGTLGDGTHPVISVSAAQLAFVDAFDSSTIAAHAIAGLGAANILTDAGSTVGAQDVTTPNITLSDIATKVGFSAGVPGNWNPVPTQAKAALDQLAASNFRQAAGNTGTGTGTVTVVTPAITKAKNGNMVVSASALISTSAGATLTLSFLRDGTPIGTNKTLVAGAALGGIDVKLDFVDAAPDNAAHTYTFTIAASAGNITCAANSAQIRVLEDS